MRALAVVLLIPALASIAWPQACSNADMRGVYLFQPSGFVQMKDLDPSFPEMMAPMKGLGLVEYDGNGKGAGQASATFGGVPAAFEFVDLNYTVNPDCSGTVEYKVKLLPSGAVFGPDRFKLLVLREGGTIRCLMVDSAGRTAIGTTELTRLSYHKLVCHQSMLRGTYAMHYDGWVNMQALNPNQAPYYAPALGVGTFKFDPDKGNTGVTAHNWGGMALDSEMLSGTWKVNSDCTAMIEGTGVVKQTGQSAKQEWLAVMRPDGSDIFALAVQTPSFVYFTRTGMQ